MAVLEYFAFEVPREQAVSNYRKLSRLGLRAFIYRALGHDPTGGVPLQWRQFHDRVRQHQVPKGYFTPFQEMASMVVTMIRGGMAVDDKTVPDISVGRTWSDHWIRDDLDARYGTRSKCEHNYPDYFPQAESNPQQIYMYPNEALAEFRRWMEDVYLPEKFPRYLKGKVQKHQIAPSVAELLLEAVSEDRLLKGPS